MGGEGAIGLGGGGRGRDRRRGRLRRRRRRPRRCPHRRCRRCRRRRCLGEGVAVVVRDDRLGRQRSLERRDRCLLRPQPGVGGGEGYGFLARLLARKARPRPCSECQELVKPPPVVRVEHLVAALALRFSAARRRCLRYLLVLLYTPLGRKVVVALIVASKSLATPRGQGFGWRRHGLMGGEGSALEVRMAKAALRFDPGVPRTQTALPASLELRPN